MSKKSEIKKAEVDVVVVGGGPGGMSRLFVRLSSG